MAESLEHLPEAESKSIPTRSILIELEYVAVTGRQITFDVLKSVLADKGAKLTPLLFSRHCLDSGPDEYLKSLLKDLDKTRVSPDALAKDISEGINMSLLDSGVTVSPGIKKIVAAAANMDITIGLLSSLDKNSATRLAENLGLMEHEDVVLVSNTRPLANDRNHNAWQTLARRIGRPAVKCLAIATSRDSCRAALASGMRCVVVCDDYTSFQDFGGADLVLDSLDAEGVKAVLALVEEN